MPERGWRNHDFFKILQLALLSEHITFWRENRGLPVGLFGLRKQQGEARGIRSCGWVWWEQFSL